MKGIKQGKLAFKMYGKKMFGEWALVKIKGRSPKGNEWLLLKHRDAYANAEIDVTEVAPQSVVSGKRVDEIGDSKNFWQSNRPAALRSTPGRLRRSAPTLADRLARSPASPPTRSARAPRKAASSRSRSSRAAPPPKARPTRRRRPR